jgi:sugar lactone lactonase YvrE
VHTSTLGEADVLVPVLGELCEGPVWDARSRRLFLVDIMAGRVHGVDPTTGSHHTWEVGEPISAIAPRAAGGWVASVERGFALFADDWRRVGDIRHPAGQPAGTRFNDGGGDPQGGFFAGTLAYDGSAGASSLYRLGVDGTVTEVVTAVTTSNGIAWRSEADTMYYVDTGLATIDVLTFDEDLASPLDRKTLVRFSSEEGHPDGLTIDSEGFVWVALWDGGCLRRYSPLGELERTVQLPVQRVTSMAFGGPRLDELFITTAWEGLTSAQRSSQPLAGSVFRHRPGVTGVLPFAYAG